MIGMTPTLSAPVVAMSRNGYRLYQDPSTGVMTGWIYGPVGAIVLFPAALAHDPTTAIDIGLIISSVCYLAPVGCLLGFSSRGGTKGMAPLAFQLFAWLTFSNEDLARCAFVSGPDAIALGLAACACGAIYLRRATFMLSLSAVALRLSCIWTKAELSATRFLE